MEENMKELNLEQMETVTGGEGSDPVSLALGCPHRHIKRYNKYDLKKKEWDGWTHVKIAYYIFKCKDCGQTWQSTDPNFKVPRG